MDITPSESYSVKSETPQRFPLMRYFSIASLVSTVVTAVVLGWIYREYAVRELKSLAQHESTAFAEVLAYSLRDEVAELVSNRSTPTAREEVIARVDRMIWSQAKYFGAAKIKIYASDGIVVYSTQKSDIGQNQAENPGVTEALDGRILSGLVERERFNTFDNVLEYRDLLQTYLPITGLNRSDVTGVFELYSDMTDLLARIRAIERMVMASVVGMLVLLYGVLFVIVRRADMIIERQDLALQAQMREIGQHNQSLEARVQERTVALKSAVDELLTEINERESVERELVQARQQAWQQEKLAAIGRLSAGIVHEFGNPLAALGGLVDTARDDLDDGQLQTLSGSLDLIKEHVLRLQNITREVSGFSVQEAYEPELINLNEIVDRVINVMRYDAKLSDVKFTVALDRHLPAAFGTPDQIWQVIMNLILNAADAIERKEGASREIILKSFRQESAAKLSVQDHGEGMDEDLLATAFEPFRTTKGPGDGLGIGLSLCYSIMRSHGGGISISSGLGEGTTVTISMPLADASAS